MSEKDAINRLIEEGGYTGADAHTQMDLTKHAATEARKAIQRVVEIAPPHMRIQVFIGALASQAQMLQDIAPEVVQRIAADDIKGAGDLTSINLTAVMLRVLDQLKKSEG